MDNGQSNTDIKTTNLTSKLEVIPRKNKQPKYIYSEYLNSANRLNGTESNFTYVIDIPKNIIFTKCCITYACIPKTFYNVPVDDYNYFEVSIDGGSNYILITFTGGNYDLRSLKDTLKTKLDNATGWTFNITGSINDVPVTGKYTFTVTGNGAIQPIFRFDSTSMYEQMGFKANTVYSFIANTLTSAAVIYLQGERTIYIRSSLTSNEIQQDNIIQEIYSNVTQNFSSIVFEQKLEWLNMKPFNGNKSNQFTFRLVDENDEIVNLNSNDWQCTIKILN